MCIRDRAQAVEDDEQAEHDGQDAHHDVTAEDQERAQAQADDARDEGELALEDAALHGKEMCIRDSPFMVSVSK